MTRIAPIFNDIHWASDCQWWASVDACHWTCPPYRGVVIVFVSYTHRERKEKLVDIKSNIRDIVVVGSRL